MAILYKYCDQLGAVKILGTLELKIPFISDVNDPLECLPIFYCKNDIDVIRARALSIYKRKNIDPPDDFEETLQEKFKTGAIQKVLTDSARKRQKEWNQLKGCLLSVSDTGINAVMWAHYAETHKGIVIGIDFDKIFSDKKGIEMDAVHYDKKRFRYDVLNTDEGEEGSKQTIMTLMVKSDNWSYEREHRTVFIDDNLKELQIEGLADFRNFHGKDTWFLRLHPLAINKVIFGLFTEESLKISIKKLTDRPELQHLKLFQVVESETFDFDLIEYK